MVDNLFPQICGWITCGSLGLDNPTLVSPGGWSLLVAAVYSGGIKSWWRAVSLARPGRGDLWDSGFVQQEIRSVWSIRGKPLESYAEYF